MFRKFFLYIFCATFLSGCVATENIRFKASANQTALNRDGRPAISSVGKQTIALLSRSSRELPQGQRVGFVIALYNRGQTPQDFQFSGIEAIQSFADKPHQPIEVLTFEKLQREERARQVVAAIIVGVAAGANSASAARAGYYRSNTTIYTPRGTYTATTTGYSPAAAAIAQTNASVQNAAMIDATVSQGQANMARLENEYIKDHTLLPNEWYGGLVGIEPPQYGAADEIKTYALTIRVGTDIHRFEIIQEPNKK